MYRNPFNDPRSQEKFLSHTERFCDSYHKHYMLVGNLSGNQWTFLSVIAICITLILALILIINS
jgi:hypothetical protein